MPWRAILLLPLLSLGLDARERWLRLHSPHFELYTDAGERAGRATLDGLHRIRQVFGNMAGISHGSPLPVRVMLFGSESEFRLYRSLESTQGFYQSGPERDYIALLEGNSDARRAALHEYVHLVLHHSSARLPRWLEEGTAEFYSTLETDGARLRIGIPVPAHVDTLARDPWLETEVFLAMDQSSQENHERRKVGSFYAQSWAMAHMLNLAPGYREAMPRFIELLAEGEPQARSFEEAFGKSAERALQDLRGYVRDVRFAVAEVGWEPVEAPRVTVSGASDLEAGQVRADLLLRIGKGEQAEKLLRRLAGRHPDSAEAEAGLGMIALGRKQYEEARGRLRRAIAMGSRAASTYFEYAMLLRDSGGSDDEVSEYLWKTVGENPNFAEAHFLLGVMASRDGRHEEAIEPLRKAASILPRQAYFWHALAFAYHRSGRQVEALRAARRVANAAVTEEEKQMARAALRLVEEENAEAQRLERSEVNTPESWKNPQGDSRVEGTLDRVECLDASARLHLSSGGKQLTLAVRSPDRVVLRNATSTAVEFPCGPQRRAVAVEYVAASGEVTVIEFR